MFGSQGVPNQCRIPNPTSCTEMVETNARTVTALYPTISFRQHWPMQTDHLTVHCVLEHRLTGGEAGPLVTAGELYVEVGDQSVDVVVPLHLQAERWGEGQVLQLHGVDVHLLKEQTHKPASDSYRKTQHICTKAQTHTSVPVWFEKNKPDIHPLTLMRQALLTSCFGSTTSTRGSLIATSLMHDISKPYTFSHPDRRTNTQASQFTEDMWITASGVRSCAPQRRSNGWTNKSNDSWLEWKPKCAGNVKPRLFHSVELDTTASFLNPQYHRWPTHGKNSMVQF